MRLFPRLLKILLRKGGYAMALAEAYFDESGTQERGLDTSVLCLAGFVIQSEQAKEMDQKWTEMLDAYSLPYFHMVDCAHGRGVFKALDLPARIAVEKRAIEVMREHIARCFAVSVDPFVFEHEAPADHPAVGSPYAFLAHSCFTHIAIWAKRSGFTGEIAYFFEAGHSSQSEANRLMNNIASVSELRERHCYASHRFAEKRSIPILQAADILAWLWHSECRRKFFRSPRPERADLKALAARRPNGESFMTVAHFGSTELKTATLPAMKNLYPLTYPWRN